jgi:glycosyltransferase involved in cell wall biosynthesis
MKVLQMVDVPWDSGLAHYALILAQGLKARGHQVFVSAIPGEKPWHKAHRLGLKTLPMVNLKGLNPLRHFVRDHHIDVINAHTGSTHSLAVAAALGQPIAVIRTRSDARAIRRRPGGKFLYGHTQRVIAAAEYIRQAFLRELKLPPKKVATVYQGIDVESVSVEPLPKNPMVGIVARLDPVKGHRYLIEALYILKGTYPGLRLRVVGQEENVKERELRNITERLRVDDRIEFMGYQTHIPKIMASCSIGVISSTGSEAVSRTALEWMAAGRPVVGTKVGCLPEMILDNTTGILVDPKDAPSLAAALAKLLHDPAKLAAMGEAGRARALDQFTTADFVDKTLGIYKAARAEV